ncbi:hypothetical protein ACFX11_019847 [Malus domestica]
MTLPNLRTLLGSLRLFPLLLHDHVITTANSLRPLLPDHVITTANLARLGLHRKHHKPRFTAGPWKCARATFYGGGSGTFGTKIDILQKPNPIPKTPQARPHL